MRPSSRSPPRRHHRQSPSLSSIHPPDNNDPDSQDQSQDCRPSTSAPDRHTEDAYEALVTELVKAKESKKWTVSASKRAAYTLQGLARLTMRFHGPYIAVSQAVPIGFLLYTTPQAETSGKHNQILEECPEADRTAYKKLFCWLLDSAPFLRPFLPLFVENCLDVTLLGEFVDFHARQGRSADINTLKKHVHLKLLLSPPLPPSSQRDATSNFYNTTNDVFTDFRDHWGFYNRRTARLLVPYSLLENFEEDPDTILDQVLSGALVFDHMCLPSFLYQEDLRVSQAEDITDGLLLSSFLMVAYRCVFEGPSAVAKAPGLKGNGRASISRKHGIVSVKPENIAYIACLVHFTLGTCDKWDQQNSAVFDGATFFKNIVKFFTNQTFSEKVLAAYTSLVYGDRAKKAENQQGHRMAPNDTARVLELFANSASMGSPAADALPSNLTGAT
ncbi:hypothetical protein C8Q73DRAFT_685072 [Cubamyces lactineus]|nr:hypothetical protein C8Q73DRAFT_699380 [Cubamyces lactineus]KAH9898507.1 hypothetical protein C8Q73DRAFT_685072 [Cubamyces lactineus]